MTCEPRTDAMETEQEQEQAQAQAHNTEDRVVVRRDGVLRSVLRGLFWPFGVVVRAYRGVWWVMGLQQPKETALVSPVVPSPARHSLAGRKRLRRVTRLLLSILPRWVQSALGYPVSSSIGRSLSPEIRVSPTKPCGKGSKRKQDELEDEEEEEHQTWVEALSQELADDEDPEEDPDYEPSSVETESEEYRSQNNTESDIEVQGKGVVIIEDVETITPIPQSALSYPVSSSIGRSLSPEIRVSPTKPCDKGSTRKQDELDEEEEEHQTWVEALGQELADDEDPEEDPDYEPSTVETDSEEYCSQNDTESDIEVQGKGVVIIEDVETDTEPPTPVQVVCPPV